MMILQWLVGRLSLLVEVQRVFELEGRLSLLVGVQRVFELVEGQQVFGLVEEEVGIHCFQS